MKWRRRAVVALVLLAALCLAVAFRFGQKRLVFPAPSPGRPPAYPDRLIQSGGATFLYFGGKTVVAYFHGNGEDLADSIPVVSLLRTLGMGVLAVEYPGYGLAGGRPSEDAVYAAAETALRWLRSEQGVEPARVILLGWSLGSGVAAEMAKRQLGARLVLIAPFTSVVDMYRRMIPFLPGSIIHDRFDTASKAGSIGIPVLIIHGTEDGVVPFEMGRRLAEAFPQARLVPVEGGEHNDLFTVHALELRNALAPFVKF